MVCQDAAELCILILIPNNLMHLIALSEPLQFMIEIWIEAGIDWSVLEYVQHHNAGVNTTSLDM